MLAHELIEQLPLSSLRLEILRGRRSEMYARERVDYYYRCARAGWCCREDFIS